MNAAAIQSSFRWWVIVAAAYATPLLAAAPARAQVKAFPQAEGFGAAANGGRGGDVYHVTSLSDNGSLGTLRHGIESAPTSGRTIVFDVGGWITLNSNLGIVSSKRNITIAGQTAPGGIGVRGAKFSVGADDVVIRHMTFRPGKGAGRVDSVNTNDDAQRVIYDHVSAGFSYDENFSVQATDVTLQFSTVSYGLQDHSAGSLLENPRRLTMHHNLYAHNHTRNPKARVFETLDWINNVVYDYNIGMNLDGTDSAGYFWTQNIDGNYYITGPGDTGNRIVTGGSVDDYGTWWGTNAYDGDGDNVHDGVDYIRGQRDFSTVWGGLTTWSETPYPRTEPVWQEATTQAAYERVLAEFGATPWNRGEVDQLLHNDVVNRSGTILTHENQLVARGVSNGGFGTLGGVAAPLDSDRDGMPDAWEIRHGLPTTTANNNGDFDEDGYTDLEEYLNDVAAFKAAGPLEFAGEGRYADWSNWTRRWEPSRLDEVHVDQGTAIVDAVGQKAGSLKIGTSAGDVAEVSITNGWLEVTDDVVIGAHDSADARLTLSNGRLKANKLSKGAGGEFIFNGGFLAVNEIDFALVNSGGTITPGSSIGHMDVGDDLTITAGRLEIELASLLSSDTIAVDGKVILGGQLNVRLLGGLVPKGGQWEIITATNGFAGSFSRISSGFSTRIDGNRLFLAAIPEPATWHLLPFAGLIAARRRRSMTCGMMSRDLST